MVVALCVCEVRQPADIIVPIMGLGHQMHAAAIRVLVHFDRGNPGGVQSEGRSEPGC